MKYTYELYEDNSGALHLAVIDGNNCIYYLADHDRDLVLSTLSDLKAGSDPIEDFWEGGEENPNECLKEIRSFVALRNGSAKEISI